MPREYKLLFAGPMGAGKTTAITAISDTPPIRTEAANTDKAQHAKAETTVAFDYGEVALPDGDRLRLYGMPGQSRFDFMWKLLADSALGVLILADNSRPDPLTDLGQYVEAFAALAERNAMVIGVGRTEAGSVSVDEYIHWLDERGMNVPVLSVDVRRKDDVLLLLDVLMNQVEAHECLAARP